MKNRFNKFRGMILLLPLVAGPLQAQTNSASAATSGHLSLMGLSGGESMIGLAAVIIGCSIPIIVVSLQLYFRHQRNKMLHETIRSMVDKGTPIPPELFTNATNGADSWPRRGPHRDLRYGLLCLGVGIGILITGYPSGWIVLLVGVAFVLASILEKRDKGDRQPPKT